MDSIFFMTFCNQCAKKYNFFCDTIGTILHQISFVITKVIECSRKVAFIRLQSEISHCNVEPINREMDYNFIKSRSVKVKALAVEHSWSEIRPFHFLTFFFGINLTDLAQIPACDLHTKWGSTILIGVY